MSPRRTSRCAPIQRTRESRLIDFGISYGPHRFATRRQGMRGDRRRWIAGTMMALSFGLTLAWSARAQERDLLVFAAASLKNALDDVDAQYKKETGRRVVVSYASSPALAKQIVAATPAPANVFTPAYLCGRDYLPERGLTKPDTRVNLLGNRLVLIAPAGERRDVTIGQNFPLATLLGDGRLAMADPDSVPAGKYGRAALERLRGWASGAGRVARAPNVPGPPALRPPGEAALRGACP